MTDIFEMEVVTFHNFHKFYKISQILTLYI